MFIGVQFPLIDSRHLIPANTNKLEKPLWGILAREGEEFVRSFGVIGKRTTYPSFKLFDEPASHKLESYLKRREASLNRGNYSVADGTFCNAERAVSFPAMAGKKRIGDPGNPFYTFCIYRRLYWDGDVSGRVEIAFRDAFADNKGPQKPAAEIDLEAILDQLMRMPVKIPRNSDDDSAVEFQRSGRKLATHFLASTTKIIDKKLSDTKKWWVQDGMPMIYVEFESHVRIKHFHLLFQAKRVEMENGLTLSYFIYRKGPKPIKVWVMENPDNIEKDYPRRIRQATFRLNANAESLKNILRHILLKKIEIKPGHPATRKLQSYLGKSVNYLNREEKFGIPQHEILSTLMEVMFTEKEYETLKTLLKDAETNLKEELDRLLAPTVPVGKKKVFISYNHGDAEFVMKLKEELEKRNIPFIIDIDAMKFGDSIREFIDESIMDSDYTLSIVSRRSLRSAWVIVESLKTLMVQEVKQTKKFIPIFIDDDFLKLTFQSELEADVEKSIINVGVEITRLTQKFLDPVALNPQMSRLIQLRNNIGNILAVLRESKVGDFSSDEKFKTNLPDLIDLLMAQEG